jgi:hypothetical protein
MVYLPKSCRRILKRMLLGAEPKTMAEEELLRLNASSAFEVAVEHKKTLGSMRLQQQVLSPLQVRKHPLQL